MWYVQVCPAVVQIQRLQMRFCLWFIAVISLVFFHMVRAGAHWHKIHEIHACAFGVQKK